MFETKDHPSPFRLLVCLIVPLTLASCSLLQKKPSQPILRYTVNELPVQGNKVILWAVEQHSRYVGPDDKKAEQEAIRWLQEHGLLVVRRSEVEQILVEQQLSVEKDGTASLLTAGKLTGAQQVILLQAYSDRVMVRGVNTETGVLAWSGTGHYKESAEEIDGKERAWRMRESLTGKTLDAIWKSKH